MKPRLPNHPSPADASVALVEAARAVFLEEGLEGLSVRRVAERAGCTTMAVYTRFGGKTGLLEALFDEGFERLRDKQASVSSQLDPAHRVLALCQAYRATAHAYPHHYALMLGSTSGSFQPSPASRQRSLSTLQTLVDAVHQTLAGKAKGAARQRQAVALAQRLFAFCHGWVSIELIGFLPEPPAARQAAFEAAVCALMQGG